MNTLTLDKLKIGSNGIIKKINNLGSIRRRLFDIGLIEGTKVKSVLTSPGKDPIAYFIRGCLIAIRNEDAKKIEVEECE